MGEAEEAVRQIGTDKRDKAKGGESMLALRAGSAAHYVRACTHTTLKVHLHGVQPHILYIKTKSQCLCVFT